MILKRLSQSKVVLLAVLPFLAASVVLQAHWWALNDAAVAVWTLGLSGLLALVVLRLRAATRGGALTGAVITASLMFATAELPYQPWHTAIVPVLAVSLLAYFSTRLGREAKERLGTAERRQGRTAAQIAANLGAAALAANGLPLASLVVPGWFTRMTPMMLMAVVLAPLAEAAADTVSSEVGQVLGGQPRLITTLRRVAAGTDGAVSLAGTLAGVAAAVLVALAGTWALGGTHQVFWIGAAGGVFGLFFDSLLGATLERRGWLNNDAVNFLSTLSAAGTALVVVMYLSRVGVG